MFSLPQSFQPLTRITYSYGDPASHQRAQGLRSLVWGMVFVGLIVLLVQLKTTLLPSNILFKIGSLDMTIPRIAIILIFVVMVFNLFIVMPLLNRGKLRLGSLACVATLYVVAVLAYGPNPPTTYPILAFTLPITAAGVMLSRRDMTVVLVIVVATVVAMILMSMAGWTERITVAPARLEEAIIYGVAIFTVDGLVLRMFAGGQRILLEHNNQLTSELKAAIQAAQQSEAKWHAIIANAPVTITYTTPTGTIEYINRSKKALPGSLVIDNTSPDQRDLVMQAIGAARDHHTTATYTLHDTLPTGAEAWFETQVGPVDIDGQVAGLAFITSDVTDRVKAAAEQARLQQQIIEAQREALRELSSPIIPIADRVIALPLVGSIDSRRAQDITRSLLAGITTYRARILILDVTGVPVIDTGVVNHLSHSIQAARLKGARTIVSGISDAVAETIVDLGIDWSQVETVRDLRTALQLALCTVETPHNN